MPRDCWCFEIKTFRLYFHLPSVICVGSTMQVGVTALLDNDYPAF